MVDAGVRYAVNGRPQLGTVAESMREALAARCPAQGLDAMVSAVASTGPWDSAAVAVLGAGGTITMAASSDDVAREVQARQQDLQQGPSCAAIATQDVLTVDDVAADSRWPQWMTAAAESGIASAVAVPLFTDGPLGVLTFYRCSPRTWLADDLQQAGVAGAHVSVVVAHARMQQNLWRAIDGRTLIGQAQGVLMERYRLSSEQAFALLRRYSQQRNTKLAVLAQQLVSTGTLDALLSDARCCDSGLGDSGSTGPARDGSLPIASPDETS